MKIALVAFTIVSSMSLFAASTASANGGAERRIAERDKRIASLNKDIEKYNQHNDADKKRLANKKEVEGMVSAAEAMPVTNTKEGNAACTAFNAAGEKLTALSKSGLSRAVDGYGSSFETRIKAGTKKVTEKLKGLTCKQIKFVVDDVPVAVSQ